MENKVKEKKFIKPSLFGFTCVLTADDNGSFKLWIPVKKFCVEKLGLAENITEEFEEALANEARFNLVNVEVESEYFSEKFEEAYDEDAELYFNYSDVNKIMAIAFSMNCSNEYRCGNEEKIAEDDIALFAYLRTKVHEEENYKLKVENFLILFSKLYKATEQIEQENRFQKYQGEDFVGQALDCIQMIDDIVSSSDETLKGKTGLFLRKGLSGFVRQTSEGDVCKLFEDVFSKLNKGAIVKKTNDPKHIPDFWVKQGEEYIPVEVKLHNFNVSALKQLTRYMDFYKCKHGMAVGSKLTVDLPKNIEFISIKELAELKND